MPEQKLIVSPLTREDVKQLIREETKLKFFTIPETWQGTTVEITKFEFDNAINAALNGYTFIDTYGDVFVLATIAIGERLVIVWNNHIDDGGVIYEFYISNGKYVVDYREL